MSRLVCVEYSDIGSRIRATVPLEATFEPVLETLRLFDVVTGAGRCGLCGCTDGFACPEGCSWVAENVCSRCFEARSDPIAIDTGHVLRFLHLGATG